MIELKNVSKWYGSVQVLTDCSTNIQKGEVVVVCGPSGSGKSTLIKTINALEPFQKGDIVVDGISIADPKTNLNRVIFMDVGGKILEDCSKDDFFGKPEDRQPRTKDFLNKILAH
eukprot:gene45167-55251_t